MLPDWLDRAEQEAEALIRSKLYRTIWTYMTRRDPAQLLAGVTTDRRRIVPAPRMQMRRYDRVGDAILDRDAAHL